MPSKIHADVAEFNTSFGHAVRSVPGLGYPDVEMRVGLLSEEARETELALIKYKYLIEVVSLMVEKEVPYDYISSVFDAAYADLKTEFLDGLADTEVVLHGAAQGTGMPIEEAFEAVHESNMTKLGPDGKPMYFTEGVKKGKVAKGPNYVTPTARLRKLLGL